MAPWQGCYRSGMTKRGLGQVGFAVLGVVFLGLGLEGLAPWAFLLLLTGSLAGIGPEPFGWLVQVALGSVLLWRCGPLANRVFPDDDSGPEPSPGMTQRELLHAGLALTGLSYGILGAFRLLSGLLGEVWTPLSGAEVDAHTWARAVCSLLFGGALVALAPGLAGRLGAGRFPAEPGGYADPVDASSEGRE